MTPTEKKAREIYEKMYYAEDVQGNYPMCKNTAKQCALICVDRNIIKYTELINQMDDFSNESRQVIYQLLDNELEIKQHLNNL